MSVQARLQLVLPRPARVEAPRPRLRRFLNRELSWIDFDRRVLALAADEELPLFERVRFCSIASSNLDEFFAVRMAGLHELVISGVNSRAADGWPPAQTAALARTAIVALQAEQDALWRDDLQPALAAAGIRIAKPEECKPRERRSLRKRCEREVLPLLSPIALGAAAPFPQVQSLGLNIGALVGNESEVRFVCISVPQSVPRFLELGTGGLNILVEDALLDLLPALVGGDIEMQGLFRVTRDADVSVSADADDLLEALETELERRRFGDVVRLEVSADTPAEVRQTLMRQLAIVPDLVYETAAPLGLAALVALAERERPELKRKPWRPVTTHHFREGGGTAFLAHIRRRDLLAHHPYEAYDTSVEHFMAASRDPKVAAMKATVYRTSRPSQTLAALAEVAADGQPAVCLVELRARFDERRNIEWSRALDRAGVQVVYGDPRFKVHAKLCLLVRREPDGLRRYVHIGSGNYHAGNASVYEDLSLFTVDDEIAADVADVFNAVTGHIRPTVFRKLLVAPWFLREGVLHEIAVVARSAHAGESARIRIKVNALVDPEITEALYAASAAGVTIEVITRGMCVLRPGVDGLSKRIRVRSVLGPFLEHSRILSFEAGDRVSTWIGSADLMPRNLERRIEVLAPVEDVRLRARIGGVLDALLSDTRFAWELGANGSWSRVVPSQGEKPVSAQEVLMREALTREERRG